MTGVDSVTGELVVGLDLLGLDGRGFDPDGLVSEGEVMYCTCMELWLYCCSTGLVCYSKIRTFVGQVLHFEYSS